VLFLKAQGVITDLEAEEYLNPQALGAGAGALQQPNLQARNVVRAGVVAHAITFCVLALFLGLIHVAPLSATPRSQPSLPIAHGYLRVDAAPWARISVDGHEIGTTPLAAPLELAEGKHSIVFEHDWYQPIERDIDIVPGTIEAAPALRVDFEGLHAALKPGKTKPADPQ
jgi:hypothetical protein